LPYLEAINLYELYDDNLKNGHTDNLDVLKRFLPVMTCPSDIVTGTLVEGLWYVDGKKAAPGSYKGVDGTDGGGWWGFALDQAGSMNDSTRGPLHAVIIGTGKYPPVMTSQITDGLTNTLMVGEYNSTTSKAFGGPIWASTFNWANLSSTQSWSYTHGYPASYDECTKLTGASKQKCVRAFTSLHSGHVMNFVTCGGNVVTISPNVDGTLFKAAGTIAGGEILLLE
jgi:hypothetical protein